VRKSRLSRKYTVALVVLVTVALVASGAVQLYSSYNESKAALVALQNEKARGAATRIETYVKEIERQLSWTTQPQLVASAAAVDQRRQDSYRLQRQVPPITELSYLDSKGREQLLISRLAMDVVAARSTTRTSPSSARPRPGRRTSAPCYFRKESEPYMTIAMPQSGGGVTVAEVNLKFIWDVVSQIKVGKAGIAYVVDRTGALIAHPDISLVLQKTSLDNLEQVKAAITPNGPEVTTAHDPKGREVLSAHSTIAPLGWVVFVDQPLEEALEPLRASARRTGLLVVAGILLSIAVSALLARRMARPIQVLQESAAKIGAGDLAHQIELRSGDELETLADEFNRMTSRLRESYATLEQKVEDRTRELSESLERQTATAEILRVISSSPTDVQPVLEAVASSALALCNANDAPHLSSGGDQLHRVVHLGPLPVVPGMCGRDPGSGERSGRDRAPHDPHPGHPRRVCPRTSSRMRRRSSRERASGPLLATPDARRGSASASSSLRRLEVRPFTEAQIELLKTFADQAVIAIENVRLFTELQARTAELTRSVGELEALGEVGRAISSTLDLETGAWPPSCRGPTSWPGPTAARSTSSTRRRGRSGCRRPTGSRGVRGALPHHAAGVRRGGRGPGGRTRAPIQVRGRERHSTSTSSRKDALLRFGYPLAPRGAACSARTRWSARWSSTAAVPARSPPARSSSCARSPRSPPWPSRTRAVPGDRGQEAPARGGQPAQVGVPGQRVARAAHPPQRHHRLLEVMLGAHVRRREREAGRVSQRHPLVGPASPSPHQRHPRPRQDRGRAHGAGGRPTSTCRRPSTTP
jgi:HAMP domain-containing protein